MAEEGEASAVRVKTRQDYSRNVKKLKVKLMGVRQECARMQGRVDALTRTSNDKLIALRIAKFCKERRFTPEMLFRFADRRGEGSVSKEQFAQTWARLGLKLSKEEVMRLEYLIDEDLSGAISWVEYNGYIDAFGIKKQFAPGELTMRDALQKLDLGKLLDIDLEDGKNRDKGKRANLLTYEEFLKYCHKNFKDMKDRQIATIFQRLQRNQLINLQHFLDYLEDQREQQRKKDEKNKKKTIKKGESMMDDAAARQKAETLKGLIQALFRSRDKNAPPIFHSSEFQRLEKLLNRKRGELGNIFKEIDSKRKGTSFGTTAYRGSFGYNELINYYIEHEKGGKQTVYAFELMALKFMTYKHTAESVVGQYISKPQVMTEDELKRFMEGEFQVKDQEFYIISKLVPRNADGKIQVLKLIEMLSVKQDGGFIFIKPNIPATQLIFRSGIMALRCCLEIQQKMVKAKLDFWNDFEFGPTEADNYGLDSIDLPLPVEKVVWQRVSALGMMQFYEAGAALVGGSEVSSSCPHQILGETIWGLTRADETWIFPKPKPNADIRDVEDKDFNYLFKGVYPYAFHPFAKYGIYVIRLWIDQRWRYVVIDSKVPCGLNGLPFFSASTNFRYCFVSLIEKALAKIHGSYKTLYSVNSMQRYIMQLTGSLCLPEPMSMVMPQTDKDRLWAQFVYAFSVNTVVKGKPPKSKMRDMLLVLFKGTKQGINANFPLKMPLKLDYALQIANADKKNKHKSHRLVLLNSPSEQINEKQWNQWSRSDAQGKFSLQSAIINQKCDKKLLDDPKTLILNYKLLRKGFQVLKVRKVDWQFCIVMRKELQFEQKYRCRYEITNTSQDDLQLVVYLRQQSLVSDCKINMQFKSAVDGKQTLVSQCSFKDQLSLTTLRFQKDKPKVLQFFVENWKSDQYHYCLTFYWSHPRFELKQRDRHMLFRYVSPFEEEQKQEWSDLSKEEKLFVYRNFYKAAEKRGCCGCL